jgi:hypothetical protein
MRSDQTQATIEGMAPYVTSPEIVLGSGWLVARYGRVQCTYFGAEVDGRSFDAYAELLARDIDRRRGGRRIGVFHHAPTVTLDSQRRRRIAQILNERKDELRRTTAAYAMATQSPFVRGVLTTLFWMAPPGYPHTVVANPQQGLSFIAEQMPGTPGIDAKAIAAAFEDLLTEQMRHAS